MEPSLRRLLAWVALVLLGTVWTVSSYLESRQVHGPAAGTTAEAPSTGGGVEGARRAATVGSRVERAASRPSERPSAG